VRVDARGVEPIGSMIGTPASRMRSPSSRTWRIRARM
jgi:hypothetical protein